MVPVLGLIAYAITSIWGLGCAVTAGFSCLRKEIPEKTIAPVAAPGAPPAAPAPPPFQPLNPAERQPNRRRCGSRARSANLSKSGPAPHRPATVIAAVTPPFQRRSSPRFCSFPRAGFWERMGAAFY